MNALLESSTALLPKVQCQWAGQPERKNDVHRARARGRARRAPQRATDQVAARGPPSAMRVIRSAAWCARGACAPKLTVPYCISEESQRRLHELR